MSWIDWAVFSVFLAYVVWDGVRRGVGSGNLDAYYAGGRKIPWWAAGLSVMATQASAITVIGTTGQGHETGMEFVQTYFGLPFAMVLLCIFMVPLLRKNPILTAYQYLEDRFGPATRTLASLIFLVSRCLALGVVIYAPGVVLSAMTGLNLTLTILLMGLLTTGYTMLGGMSAVVWTDVKQMSVIFLGLFLCLGILFGTVSETMDFSSMLKVMGASGKLNAVEASPESWDFVPRLKWAEGPRTFWEDRYNLWSGLLGGLFLMLAYFGCDQSQAQRILTNPTANESKKTLLLSAFAKVPMQVVILFVGALLFLFFTLGEPPILFNPNHRAEVTKPEYRAQFEEIDRRYSQALDSRRGLAVELGEAEGEARSHPQLLERYQKSVTDVAAIRKEARDLIGAGRDTNYIFPHFMLTSLPPIVLGLLIAAIFAAAMSSIDSVLNSLSAATVVDFYQRWLNPTVSERNALQVGRFTTVFWGLVATIAAWQFAGGGSVIELVNRVGSFFYGTLLGVFVLGRFFKRAGPKASFAGLIGGMSSVMVVHYTLRFEFLWYNIIGCIGVLLVGWIVSRFESTTPSPRPRES